MSRKDEVRVEQAIIDRISTGNFFNTFVETLNETQRGMTFDLPQFAGEGAIAAMIGKQMFDQGADFTDAWNASEEERKNGFNPIKKYLSI